MTRFIRRATIAAALIAAPMITLSAPAFAAGAAQPATTSVVSAKSTAGPAPAPRQTTRKKRPASSPTPATSPAPTGPAATPVVPGDYEAQVVTLTNAQRTAAGCGALRTDDRLVTAARMHSNDMVTRKFFSHTGSNGSTFVAREAQAGYSAGASAENIAWGYRTPQEVVTGWMNSAGHRANILDCTSVAVGVGLALAADGTPYWTQDFGRI